MDSFLNIALKAMRRQSAGYDAAQLQRELDRFARPWRKIFGFWFAAILFGACVIASSLLTGSAYWFGLGITMLLCAIPLPYLLQHRFCLNGRWNSVPASLQPLATELESFARGEREAYRQNGDIAERQLFRSTIAILLISENRFDRFMVMLNPIRSYSTLLKAAQPMETNHAPLGKDEPVGSEHAPGVTNRDQAVIHADEILEAHWISLIEPASLAFRLDGLASIWTINQAAGWSHVYEEAQVYFSEHPRDHVNACIDNILDAKKYPIVATLLQIPSRETLKKALSRSPLESYLQNRKHLEGKIDRADSAYSNQIPLEF
jgi:hypothetical protein